MCLRDAQISVVGAFLKKAHSSEDLPAESSNFLAEFGKRRIPCGIVGQKQPSGSDEGKCDPIFPQHVVGRMETVMDEDIDLTDFLKKLWQQNARITDVQLPSSFQPLRHDPPGRLAGRKIVRVA